MKWLTDPKTKQPSVSLTILMISFVAAVVAAGLHLAKVTDSTSTCTELFYSACTLYFGRRFTFAGKSFSSDTAQQIEQKIENITNIKE
jgi:hypothetical protein